MIEAKAMVSVRFRSKASAEAGVRIMVLGLS
jgi:hypothetical protein